ncbi:MAG TPA: adenylate/guanylate cyclase domain-containing protein [Candidatus Baltobacteraceae bacterium]|nr:adenylate/guanylate cyclase domain-containing protein [Candidatus Baltobacteraceae bacterium]
MADVAHAAARPLPNGTVTLMFTDVEGSTQRWERRQDAMQEALRRHDAIVRRAIAADGGIVFKTMGDAFCAAFKNPGDAARAAIALQQALDAEDFSEVDGLLVRVALHTGVAVERDGDYFGPVVNRVARLTAIAHGGQVLLSGVSANLLKRDLPEQFSLRDLGTHRLKDLGNPEHVYQLVAPHLRTTFPPLRSLDHLSNNLPARHTSFVGREDVTRQLEALLKEHRLVTLVGSGGVGKTSCATQVGAHFIDDFRDGVWLIELAPISDYTLVQSVLARTLGIPESPENPLLESVLMRLRRKRLLLILDNCEHVIAEVRRVVSGLLHGCPELRVLVTSRESLNIAGEELYRMPSLDVPPPMEESTADTLLQYSSAILFADRAHSVDKGFTITNANAPFVADICRRLDGIPLAIELAANRLKVFSPEELSRTLDQRFRILTGGDPSALPRQQTMRALIDWSYDLLSDYERRVFRRLAIFSGRFTFEFVQAVCTDEAMDRFDVLDLLASLVDKSLVQAQAAGGETRYRLLESTREYGRRRLAECGEETPTARAHAVAYAAFCETLEAGYETTADAAWIAALDAERENWQAALEWTLGGGNDVTLGQQIVSSLRWFWTYVAPGEGHRWLQACYAADVAISAPAAAKLALTLAQIDGVLSLNQASHEAAQSARALYVELNEPLLLADALRLCGRALVLLGEWRGGEELLHVALQRARVRNAQKLQAAILQCLAWARQSAGDLIGARDLYRQALDICSSCGAKWLGANLAGSLAETEFRFGDPVSALRLAYEALSTIRHIRASQGEPIALAVIAAYLIATGKFAEARASANEALVLSRDLQLEADVAFILQHFAAIAALRPIDNELDERRIRSRGARLLGYVDARLSQLEAVREYTEQQENEKTIAALHAALGEAEFMRLAAEGREWTEEQALAEAALA